MLPNYGSLVSDVVVIVFRLQCFLVLMHKVFD